MEPFRPVLPGERIMLVDAKERRYLVTMVEGASFHTHAGIVSHDDIIGADEGNVVVGSTGRNFLVLRPTLADVVVKMPRGAQVIYPKDLGAILIAADIGPGMRVLEAGVGSGALSMTLLRAGVSLLGYEIREDFATHARKNVVALLGDDVDYTIEIRDVTEGIEERGLDRRDHGDPQADVARRKKECPSRPPHGGAHGLPDYSETVAGYTIVSRRGRLCLFDEDALSGALFRSLNDGVLQVVRNARHAS